MRRAVGAGLILCASLLTRRTLLDGARTAQGARRALAAAFETMEAEIRLLLTPLPTLLRRPYDARTDTFFARALQELERGAPLREAWRRAAQTLPLPEEERELARYAARVDDPDFEEIRGVLGYLSIGREKKARRARTVRMYSFAVVAASIVAVVAIGLNIKTTETGHQDELCVRYSYGEFSNNNEQIMSSVESSLADFFAGSSLADNNLREIFQR